eukprot:g58923.t1
MNFLCVSKTTLQKVDGGGEWGVLGKLNFPKIWYHTDRETDVCKKLFSRWFISLIHAVNRIASLAFADWAFPLLHRMYPPRRYYGTKATGMECELPSSPTADPNGILDQIAGAAGVHGADDGEGTKVAGDSGGPKAPTAPSSCPFQLLPALLSPFEVAYLNAQAEDFFPEATEGLVGRSDASLVSFFDVKGRKGEVLCPSIETFLGVRGIYRRIAAHAAATLPGVAAGPTLLTPNNV